MRIQPPGRWRRGAASALVGLIVALAATTSVQGGDRSPATGRFLVAERQLDDPNFVETVVLLVDYDSDGAMGLIVNWPTEAPVGMLLPDLEGIERRADTVWVGGPVSRQLMMMLMRSEEDLPGAERVFADVHFSSSRELLERLAAGAVEVGAVRLYSGYAGWAPGQLEMELAVGGWRVLPGDSELIFDTDPDAIWSRLMARDEIEWTGRPGPATGTLAP